MARTTITSATKQAHDESHMYRQGDGWIVSTWDEDMRLNYLSGEDPWDQARTHLTEWCQDRVVELLGKAGELDAAARYINRLAGTGYDSLRIRGRLKQALPETDEDRQARHRGLAEMAALEEAGYRRLETLDNALEPAGGW